MSGITFQGALLSEVSDADLLSWCNQNLRSHKKHRLREDIANLWIGIIRIFDEIEPPMTTRQVFYQAENRELVPKTEPGYSKVQRQLLNARRADVVPYEWVADHTRWMRKPTTFNSIEDFLKRSQDAYRRSVWASQPDYVEIWIEKDALAGVIAPITERWDVPLMVTRGFTSESFAYSAAESIKENGKPTYIYYFGDHDPSGVHISVDLEKKLRGFLSTTDIPFHFSRVAILDHQISQHNLPTRPTKMSDTRAKNWDGESVELDALRADVLREMVEHAITGHIDHSLFERTMAIERAERETLRNVRLATHFEEVPA